MRGNLNNKITLMILILIVSLLVSACGNESGKTKRHTLPLKVYTTIAPLSDFAKRIGGDDVEVQSILPPGVDAHTFEPTSKQIVEIAKADSFIYNGLGMESYATKIADSLKGEDVLILQAAKNVSTVKGETHEDEHDHGDDDPHVWLDPIRAITIAENIKDALIQLHPDGKQLYEKNFNVLKDDLKDLDHEFRKLADSKKDPEMVVSHAAYGYWQDRYGIKQIPIAGLSPSEEPSQKDLRNIIALAKQKHIKYVIFEQNVTPKVAEIIRKEIHAKPLYVHNLAVYTEKDIANGEDYFSLMHKNLKTLNKALQ